jgi:hypothetical protein
MRYKFPLPNTSLETLDSMLEKALEVVIDGAREVLVVLVLGWKLK